MMLSKTLYFPAALVLALAGGCSKTHDLPPNCPRPGDCRLDGPELRAHRLRSSPHGVQHGRGPAAAPGGCDLGSGSLSTEVEEAVGRALADERRAESEYAELARRITGFPLERIRESEARHAFELERLLTVHGHPIPAAPARPEIHAGDLRAACALGVASERRNIAVYDDLLSTSLPSDVRCVFERLRSASTTRHLPAFERCAAQ